MLLIVQLGLTYQAWQKGWRFLALLPMSIAVLFGVVIGSVVEEMTQAIILALITDLIAVGVLIAMKNREPHPVHTPATSVPALTTSISQ